MSEFDGADIPPGLDGSAKAEVLHTGFGVDTTDFAKFSRALRKGAPDLAKALRLRLRTIGQMVADEAKIKVEPYSESIPPSIKVRVSGAGVAVVAGGDGVPLAGLFELGNKGSRNSETFRHPVFGNRDVWVNQSMHPFLAAAFQDKFSMVEEEIGAALEIVIGQVVK